MLVSVIIPTFNRAQQVTQAVDSVLRQTHQELEAIVVDDGSTDGTAAAIARLRECDPRVTYLQQSRSGVAAARNLGLAQARGELIAFLDSDDVWMPWKLSVQLACLEQLPDVGMIWTDMRAVDRTGSVVDGSSLRDILTFRYELCFLFEHPRQLSELTPIPAELRAHTLYWGDIYGKMVLGNLVLASAALMTRARADQVGPYDETLKVAGEDFDYFLRVSRAGAVAFVDVPSVLKQQDRDDQLTHRSRQLHLARNYLRTMETALVGEPNRIDASPEMLRGSRAYAHVWIAESALEAGDSASARTHLRSCLRLAPTKARALCLLPLAFLPPAISKRLLAGVRRAVNLRRLRGSTAPARH